MAKWSCRVCNKRTSTDYYTDLEAYAGVRRVAELTRRSRIIGMGKTGRMVADALKFFRTRAAFSRAEKADENNAGIYLHATQ